MSEEGARILVADDNGALVHVLSTALTQDGHRVMTAPDGREALRLAAEAQPDLVILDVGLPGFDGWEVCAQLRSAGDVPIIFLTAYAREEDIVRGLGLGADGYLTKPFSLSELRARVAAKLRRQGSQERLCALDGGRLVIDLSRGVVRKDDREVALSPNEYRLLACLAAHPGQMLDHAQLLRDVWGPGYEQERAYLALYVRYLRQKLEDDPAQPRFIRTHHRMGYSLGHSGRVD